MPNLHHIQTTSRWNLNCLMTDVGFINDRIICGDMSGKVALQKAKKMCQETSASIDDLGAQAWIDVSIGFDSLVNVSYQITFPTSDEPQEIFPPYGSGCSGISGNLTPSGINRHL